MPVNFNNRTVLEVYLKVVVEPLETYFDVGYTVQWYKGENYDMHARPSGTTYVSCVSKTFKRKSYIIIIIIIAQYILLQNCQLIIQEGACRIARFYINMPDE